MKDTKQVRILDIIEHSVIITYMCSKNIQLKKIIIALNFTNNNVSEQLFRMLVFVLNYHLIINFIIIMMCSILMPSLVQIYLFLFATENSIYSC